MVNVPNQARFLIEAEFLLNKIQFYSFKVEKTLQYQVFQNQYFTI